MQTTIITYNAEGLLLGQPLSGVHNPEAIFRNNELAVRVDIDSGPGEEECRLTFWRGQFDLA